jgi:hypothetical protein
MVSIAIALHLVIPPGAYRLATITALIDFLARRFTANATLG